MYLKNAIEAHRFRTQEYPIYIEYRTIWKDEDILCGGCRYEEDGTLVSLDGDIYSLYDKIYMYESYKDENKLVVWFESEWESS